MARTRALIDNGTPPQLASAIAIDACVGQIVLNRALGVSDEEHAANRRAQTSRETPAGRARREYLAEAAAAEGGQANAANTLADARREADRIIAEAGERAAEIKRQAAELAKEGATK